MADFFSLRFGKNVWLTQHARASMRKRGVTLETLAELIESGGIKRKSEAHLWIYYALEGRGDNLVCAAAVEQAALVIKTVMINWELEDET